MITLNNKTAFLLLFVFLLAAVRICPAQPAYLVLVNVTVIDATGSPAKPNMTVVIKNDRIERIAISGQVKVPKKALVINGRGKFLIPGLWDMHVHTENADSQAGWNIKDEIGYVKLSDYGDSIPIGVGQIIPEIRVDEKKYLGMYIANGVTGIRDMYTVNKERFAVTVNDIASGRILSPRILKGGYPLFSGNPNNPTSRFTEEQIKEALDELERSGATFVKVHDLLSREQYFAIRKHSRDKGVYLVGHVPISVSPLEASDARQRSIEHLSGLMLASSNDEAKIKETILDACQPQPWKGFSICEYNYYHAFKQELLDTFNENKVKGLAARFVKNETWQCPTLVVLRNGIFNNKRFVDKNLLKYFTPQLIDDWDLSFAVRHDVVEPALQKTFFQKQLELVRLMHKAGVKFLAGTDSGVAYIIPGFSLHDELELLVSAGLSPMEALQTATYNVAEYHGLFSFGTVEEGKTADLVLLEDNPLQNISNTRKITGVILNGKYLNKKFLKNILDDIQFSAKP